MYAINSSQRLSHSKGLEHMLQASNKPHFLRIEVLPNLLPLPTHILQSSEELNGNPCWKCFFRILSINRLQKLDTIHHWGRHPAADDEVSTQFFRVESQYLATLRFEFWCWNLGWFLNSLYVYRRLQSSYNCRGGNETYLHSMRRPDSHNKRRQ